MAYEPSDIQFSDQALGLGRALRIVFDDGTRPVLTQDPDNDKIVILELQIAGGGSIPRNDDYSNMFLLMGG